MIESDVREMEDVMESGYQIQELCFQREGMKIYGKIFLPEGVCPAPLVILYH